MADTYRVLLIEDNPGDARLLKELLVQAGATAFVLEWADLLAKGLERLRMGGIDAVLLDLALPDSRGFQTFVTLHAEFPEMPVILLTGLDDEDLAVRAVREGAQDYMVKGQVSGAWLIRSMRYAIERQRKTARLEMAPPRKKGRILGFTGAKGGVGATTLALNVGAALAQKSTVIALELRSYRGSFCDQLHQNPALNLSRLLHREEPGITDHEIFEALYRCPSGLQVVFGPQNGDEYREITPEHASTVISRLATRAEYLVIDFPCEPSPTSQAGLRKCDFVTVVTEPEAASIAAAADKLRMLNSWGIGSALIGTVFNTRVLLASPMKFSEARAQLDSSTLGMVPPAPDAFVQANQSGVPLVLLRPESGAGFALAELARRYAQVPVEVLKF